MPAVAPSPRARLWVAAGGVLCLTFALRFYGLADHPPGTWFDPAYNGLDALRILQRGGDVLFFPTNGGRESLFVYLLIPSIWLFGATPFAMRLVTALMGVLHVALLFGFLYDLPSLLPSNDPLAHRLRRFPRMRVWLATIGSLVMATSYWHLLVSLRAERPIMVSLLSVPVAWFLLKAWHTRARRWFILTGLALGLGAYTYGAARLMPVIVAIAILPELAIGRTHPGLKGETLTLTSQQPASQRRAVRSPAATTPDAKTLVPLHAGIGWLTLAAVLTALPMAGYFATHLGQFSARAGSVAVWQYVHTPWEIVLEVGRNVPRVLGYFCCVGGTTLYNGLPDVPGVTLLLAPFLAVGFVGAVLNCRRLAHRLMWLWWLIGLAPSVLAIEAPHPLRMLVALAPTAILIALAPFYLAGWLERAAYGTRPAVSAASSPPVAGTLRGQWAVGTLRGLPALVAVLALLATPFTWRAYFVDWAGSPAVRRLNDAAALSIRDATLEHTAAGSTVYLPLSRLNDAPLLYYLGGAYQRQALLTAPPPTGDSVVIAPEREADDAVWMQFTGDTATLLPPLTDAGMRVIRDALAGAAAAPVLTAEGDTAGWLARLPADPGRWVESPSHALAVSFGSLRLTGISYPRTITPNDLRVAAAASPAGTGASQSLPVTSYWQTAAAVSDEYEVLIHLVDDHRRAWGNGDGRPNDWVYPTSFWRPGQDTVAARQDVTLQAETLPPPGRYWLAIAVYDPATGRRLPITAGSDGSPDTYLAGPLKVPLPPPAEALVQRARPEDARLGDVARLAGAVVDPTPAQAGQELAITLLWQALSTPAVDYTVFVHLLDAGGNLAAGADSQPVGGAYPTGIWSPGEVVADAHTVRLVNSAGAPLPAGVYRLAVGMYNLSTGERLPVTRAGGQRVETRAVTLDLPLRVEAGSTE